jgi:hypothetical protein
MVVRMNVDDDIAACWSLVLDGLAFHHAGVLGLRRGEP